MIFSILYLAIGAYFAFGFVSSFVIRSYPATVTMVTMMLLFWPIILLWGYLESQFVEDGE